MKWLIQLLFPRVQTAQGMCLLRTQAEPSWTQGISPLPHENMELLGGSSHLVIANHGELVP